MILTLTTLKGKIPNLVKVRWEAVAYIDAPPEGAPKTGCFIYFIGGNTALWVTQTPEEIEARLSAEEATSLYGGTA